MILLCAWVLSAFPELRAGEEKPGSPDSFFAAVATVKSLSCRFSQEQAIRGLSRPIRLTGSYHMTREGDLAWIVRSPMRFYCVIRNGKLTSWDAEAGRERSIDLKEHPAFSVMIDMMKDFFAGRISVTKDYRCTLLSAHKILLIPAPHNPLAGNVAEIGITLSADRRSITVIEIAACGGDRTTMRFEEIVLDRPIPESVWKNGAER